MRQSWLSSQQINVVPKKINTWVLNVSFYTPVDRDADPSPWIFMTATSFWSWPLTMLPKTTPTYPVDAQGWNSGWNFSTFSLISVPAPDGGSQRQAGSRHISEGAKKGILPRAKTSFPYILFWACPWSSESSETVRTAHHKKWEVGLDLGLLFESLIKWTFIFQRLNILSLGKI